MAKKPAKSAKATAAGVNKAKDFAHLGVARMTAISALDRIEAAMASFKEMRRLEARGEPISAAMLAALGEPPPFGYALDDTSLYWHMRADWAGTD